MTMLKMDKGFISVSKSKEIKNGNLKGDDLYLCMFEVDY